MYILAFKQTTLPDSKLWRIYSPPLRFNGTSGVRLVAFLLLAQDVDIDPIVVYVNVRSDNHAFHELYLCQVSPTDHVIQRVLYLECVVVVVVVVFGVVSVILVIVVASVVVAV